MRTITVTEMIGALTLRVRTAGLSEGAGGVAVRFMLFGGSMTSRSAIMRLVC